MSSVLLVADDARRNFRRQRIFRDRTNALDYLNDTEVIERYRLPRAFLYKLIDLVNEDVKWLKRRSQHQHRY